MRTHENLGRDVVTRLHHGIVACLLVAALAVPPAMLRAQVDTTTHRARLVAVDSAVRLEVIDWGGSGRPVVLLAGGGSQRYTRVSAPLLALYAEIGCRAESNAADDFRRLFPSARVVCLPQSEHYVWQTNEADVLREMRAFIDSLPRATTPD